MERHKYLTQVLKTIWNRRWLILTTTMAVLTATLWWANGLPRVYESSVVLAYTKGDASSVEQQLLTKSYEQLLNKQTLQPLMESDLFKEHRASGASADRLTENLKQNTTIVKEPRAEGFAIRLRYRDRTPERTLAIAGRLGETMETLPVANGDGGVFKVEPSSASATLPVVPRRTILTEVAIIAGVLLGLALAAIAEVAKKFRHGKLTHNHSH